MVQQRVLVTGGAGFIAGHCILQLLEQGHIALSTIRSLAKEAAARIALKDAGMVHPERLSFVQRIVLTSAFHAVSRGHRQGGHVFTEADWTSLDRPGVNAHGGSTTLAENVRPGIGSPPRAAASN